MNTESENWKDIEHFEGYYQISNLGNVRSVSRQVSKHEFRPGKTLKPKLQYNVYKVGLTNKAKIRRDYRIDFLVAKAFVNGYKEGMVVCHIDCDPFNNKANNLMWIHKPNSHEVDFVGFIPSEIWKDIDGFEGQYQVSNMGRVRSMPREMHNVSYKGKLINTTIGHGYVIVNFGGKSFPVHRLVAKAFCEGYAEGLVVNHIDEVKTNNHAENLEWITPEYNKFYGTAMARAKKKIRAYADIRRKIREGKDNEKLTRHQQDISVPCEEEVWADIPEYEGVYQISSCGRVKSLPQKHPSVNGGFYLTRERILCPRKHRNGYLNVQLCRNGNKRNYYVHRLVAKTFLRNDNPKEYIHVNHINEDKTDNRVNNLEWCDRVYNAVYGTKIKRMLKCREVNKTMQKIVEKKNQAGSIGAEKPVACFNDNGCIIAEYKSLMAEYRATGISAAKICECCKGKRNKAGGFHWQYAHLSL